VVVLFLAVATMVAGGTIAGGWGTALLFALIILHATLPSTLIGRLRFPWLRYLGRISYGMYIFHVLVVILVVKAGTAAAIAPSLLPLLAFAATVLAGTLSWFGIERSFLLLRRRFGSMSTKRYSKKTIS
jgi:peptidoglycan/LPS O-acetylase OafA/YrhL